jgi:3-oxoacyl-[acyl-carrier-protein] synthase-1
LLTVSILKSPDSPSIVVTGLGFITSIGNDYATVSQNLRSLSHGLSEVSFLDNPDIPVKVVGSIEGFELDSPYYQKWSYPKEYSIPKNLLRALPPHGVYAYCALEQAISDANLEEEAIRHERTALYCASAGSPFLMHHYAEEMKRNRGMRGSPFGVVSTISGTLNFNLGSYYGFQGGNCGFVSACSSFAHAIGFAMDQIALGRIDRAIIIGAEDLNPTSILPFSTMRVLSSERDPTLASCPFDQKRNGFVGSGGAVAIVIERSDVVAKRTKLDPYGQLAGWAQTSDGYNPAIAEPNGTALQRCMKLALEEAGTAAAEISYVNAHATSTIQGDLAEAGAIYSVFESCDTFPYVSSTKALTGHPLSMAGGMEVAFCLQALKEGFIPGQAHLRAPDPKLPELNIPKETIFEQPKAILKNSCGFGGSNVSIVLKPFEAS